MLNSSAVDYFVTEAVWFDAIEIELLESFENTGLQSDIELFKSKSIMNEHLTRLAFVSPQLHVLQ